MYTDTHCHVLTAEYGNIEKILENLQNDNIKRIIINGYDNDSNHEVMNLIQKYQNAYGALGIHPDNIENDNIKTLNYIKANLDHKKIIAVGEIGLDYYHNQDNKEKQIELLTSLLDIAKDNNKPVILHCRNATTDMLNILNNYKLKGIIHCFADGIETANKYINLGYKLGINGILTFKNSGLDKVIEKISIDNILLETDAPYLTPVPFRSKQNEPKYIIYTAKRLAEIKKVSEKELALMLEKNFSEIFDI